MSNLNRVVIYPYKIESGSAKALQKELTKQGIKCIRVYPDGNYKPKESDLVITWGNYSHPKWDKCDPNGVCLSDGLFESVNWWNLIQIARNKLATFQVLKEAGVSIPEFTTDKEYVVKNWKDTAFLIRQTLTGQSGVGIVYIPPEATKLETIPNAPLYVKYIKKAAEYRVHVFNGKVIDVQQKKKRKDYKGTIDQYIRNYSRGWVFCRENVNPPNDVLTQSLNAIKAIGLDFGAVDIIWNSHYNKAFVLEVNTAPGLEGTTVTNYCNAIKALLV